MESPIRIKSFKFGVEIVQFCRKLKMAEKEYSLCDQLQKSWTSIGANVVEWQAGQSKKDFLAKMYISLKESHETTYRLNIFLETWEFEKYREEIVWLLDKNTELTKLLTAITRSTKQSLEN